MRCFLVLCTVFIAANGAALNHPFPNGYHIDVGIPLAEQIYEKESAILSGSRIAGGEPSLIGAHPYLAAVLTYVKNTPSISISTASLISNNKVLWAAHCWNYNGEDFGESSTVVLGSNSVFSGGLRVNTNRVAIHPEWDYLTLANDIAILTINQISFISNLIQPVALPFGTHQDNDFAETSGQIVGYGRTDTSPFPDLQHYANVEVITNEECRISFPLNVFDSTICTRAEEGVGICTGDSGGPLVTQLDGQTVQIGVSSFIGGTCGGTMPSGYARVTYYLPWILARLFEV